MLLNKTQIEGLKIIYDNLEKIFICEKISNVEQEEEVFNKVMA
jgi:molecular chaperone GrpE (heat shock protein)